MSKNFIIDATLFTPLPINGNEKKIFKSFKIIQKEDTLAILKDLENKIGLNLQTCIYRLEKLDINLKWSPLIFKILQSIKSNYVNNQFNKLIDCLHFLNIENPDHFYNKNLYIESILTEWWERDFIEEYRNSNPQENLSMNVRPVLTSNLTSIKNAIYESLNLINESNPQIKREFDEYVSCIKLFSGNKSRGVTSLKVFGAIYLRIPNESEDYITFFCNHLVHELAHLHLNQLMIQDPLLTNGQTLMVYNPLRPDKRPLFGTFHATFVLYRNILVFKKLILNNPKNLLFKKDFEICKKKFIESFNITKSNSQLTKYGTEFLDTLECFYKSELMENKI